MQWLINCLCIMHAMAHQLPKKACMSSIIYLKAQENQIRDEKKEKNVIRLVYFTFNQTPFSFGNYHKTLVIISMGL